MTEKIAVVAPIPSARVRIAATANPGDRLRPRQANRTSARKSSTVLPRRGETHHGPAHMDAPAGQRFLALAARRFSARWRAEFRVPGLDGPGRVLLVEEAVDRALQPREGNGLDQVVDEPGRETAPDV